MGGGGRGKEFKNSMSSIYISFRTLSEVGEASVSSRIRFKDLEVTILQRTGSFSAYSIQSAELDTVILTDFTQ